MKKKKDFQNLARRIAILEMKYEKCNNPQERKKIEKEIMSITSSIKSISDLDIIDEMILEEIKKLTL